MHTNTIFIRRTRQPALLQHFSNGANHSLSKKILSSLSSSRTVVDEFPASDLGTFQDIDKNKRQTTTTYVSDQANNWIKRQYPQSKIGQSNARSCLFDNVISHFLPAHYPQSVQPGYIKFTTFCFAASVFGSAGMVLSTQTLLLAVGVVGSQQMQTAGVLAGALNWILKDGVGQLGGILFASRMGHTKRFDTHPKKWRMTAALALDSAALMEIMSPFVATWLVLPVACTANVLKNIGFLTASASRAALHQSIALNNNLADVTVKAGSQSMAAGLVGTALGVALSTTVLDHDPFNFVLGFFVLSAVHQGCNFMSLRYVAIDHLNRPRLDLLLDEYIKSGQVMTPEQVAINEPYLPLVKDKDSSDWLEIGRGLDSLAPNGPAELDELRVCFPDAKYLIAPDHEGNKVYLTFLGDASGDDLIKGVLHARLLRKNRLSGGHFDRVASIQSSFIEVKADFHSFVEHLQLNGWRTASTNIEPSGSRRLAIKQED